MPLKIVTRFFVTDTKQTILDDKRLFKDSNGSVVEVTSNFNIRRMPQLDCEETVVEVPDPPPVPKTRQEHLDWCKQRAFRYLDEGDSDAALKSFLSDMSKHEETKEHPMLSSLVMMPLKEHEIRSMIKDFN